MLDLLIKNGRVVDEQVKPPLRRCRSDKRQDRGVRKLNEVAMGTINADGRVVAQGLLITTRILTPKPSGIQLSTPPHLTATLRLSLANAEL